VFRTLLSLCFIFFGISALVANLFAGLKWNSEAGLIGIFCIIAGAILVFLKK
jgi:uncharacterized membrane protein